jgi:hypothetical protein
MENETVKVGTKLSEELISLIETRASGFLVSITRNVKVGRTASEISTVKMEGNAKSIEEALSLMGNLDFATMQFIKNEAAMYGIDLAAQPNKPSPVENK